MIEKIKELEQIARELESGPHERKVLREQVVQYTEDFLHTIDDSKAFSFSKDKGDEFLDFPISEKGESMDKLINIVRDNVDSAGINAASGGHLGYIPGGGIFPSALGDYMAAVSNRYAGMYFASPGAVRMENMLIRWVCDLMGYPANAAGNITSGGSIANLIAVVAARDSKKVKAADFNRLVIYMSEQTHHCIPKAFNVAGLREAVIRKISMDEGCRINTKDLESLIQQDLRDSLIPFMVIGSAGTTDVGAVDPLNDIADIAAKFDLWFHIDAAYGGFFTLLDDLKDLLKGIERSDSMVVDPHKGLFLPYGTGMVIVREAEILKASNSYHANYMQDAVKEIEELSPADVSPELSKHFRGMRMWLPLKLFGLRPFRAALEEKILLARYFYHQLKAMEGYELGPFPDLSVVIFRYLPGHGDANEFNRQLNDAVQKDGRIFISSTMIKDKFFLRIAVLSFRTHRSHIDQLLMILKEKVEEKQTLGSAC